MIHLYIVDDDAGDVDTPVGNLDLGMRRKLQNIRGENIDTRIWFHQWIVVKIPLFHRINWILGVTYTVFILIYAIVLLPVISHIVVVPVVITALIIGILNVPEERIIEKGIVSGIGTEVDTAGSAYEKILPYYSIFQAHRRNPIWCLIAHRSHHGESLAPVTVNASVTTGYVAVFYQAVVCIVQFNSIVSLRGKGNGESFDMNAVRCHRYAVLLGSALNHRPLIFPP